MDEVDLGVMIGTARANELIARVSALPQRAIAAPPNRRRFALARNFVFAVAEADVIAAAVSAAAQAPTVRQHFRRRAGDDIGVNVNGVDEAVGGSP